MNKITLFVLLLIIGFTTNAQAPSDQKVDPQNYITTQYSDLNEVQLYPNPVIDKLHIKVAESIKLKSIAIYNLLGERIKVVDGKTNILDMSKMPSGIYIIRLQTPQGPLTKKVVKK